MRDKFRNQLISLVPMYDKLVFLQSFGDVNYYGENATGFTFWDKLLVVVSPCEEG
jgi:hypothetical protein